MDDCNRKSEELIEEIEGLVTCIGGSGRDESGGKRSEVGFSSSEERLKILFESAPDGIFLNDLQGAFVDGNKAAEELIGYARAELIGKSFVDAGLLSEEQIPRALENLRKNAQGEPTGPDEFTLRRKDGGYVTVEIRSYPVEVDGQKLLLGIARDITLRKRAEKELRASKRFSENIIETANALIVVLNAEGEITTFNRFAEELTGFDKQDVLGKKWFDLFIPEDERAAIGEVHQKVLQDKPEAAIHENIILTKDGEKKLIRWNNQSIKDEDGQAAGVIAIGIDVTEHRQAEEKERVASERLRLSIDNMLEGYGLHEAIFGEDGRMVDFRYLDFNPAAQRIVGVTREQIIGKTALEMLPAIVERGLMDKYAEVIATGKAAHIEDFYYEGDNLDKAFDISCFRVDHKHFVCIFSDVTERKKAEVALRESEEHYRMLAETMNDGLGQLDENGKYVYVNKRHGEIFGYSPEEMIGRHWTEFHEPDAQEIIKRQLAKRRKGSAEPYEATNTRRDGKKIHLRISPQPIFDEGGEFKGSLSILTDITELKKAEAKAREHQSELAHVWRVNTMGEMASGLAHEINQPLCAIMNYANVCLRMMKTQTEMTEQLTGPIEQIASQAARAGEIIKRIRGLVAKRKPMTSAVDINGIVLEVVELEKTEAGNKEITVRTKFAEDLPQVMVDKVEIEEVILNLVRNAFDAMTDPVAERREVTITTRLTEDNMVEVCVEDTGKGFAAIGQQIFDSFFTTKPEGLGIGLSISRTIVELHRGKLWAEDNPDCGASFRFTLPAISI